MREGADCDERDRDGSREKSESEKKVERFGCEDFRTTLGLKSHHKFTLKDQNNNITKN